MPMQHVHMFCPRAEHLVLLCLGSDIALLSSTSEPNAKPNTKPKKECLRVTMVHGDMVVLSGGQFEVRIAICIRHVETRTDILRQFSIIWTGICMCKLLYVRSIISC